MRSKMAGAVVSQRKIMHHHYYYQITQTHACQFAGGLHTQSQCHAVTPPVNRDLHRQVCVISPQRSLTASRS